MSKSLKDDNISSYHSESSEDDIENTIDISDSMLSLEEVNILLKEYYESNICYNAEALLCFQNPLFSFPRSITVFRNLRTLDVSKCHIVALDDCLSLLHKLNKLVIKNNYLEQLPKCFSSLSNLRELNLSGNKFTFFPKELLKLKDLLYLYMGSNQLSTLPKSICRMQSLQVLYLGGNLLREIPAEIGSLSSLHFLALCQNQLRNLPASISELKSLHSLLLHGNKLTTLPPEIVTLRGLQELSLRDNPLVVLFVKDMLYNPSTLRELSARIIKVQNISYDDKIIPLNLKNYLSSAHHCLNPKCNGVYFDNRIEHIKFVDFCGKYHIPLLQFLCSPRCSEGGSTFEMENVEMENIPLVRLRKALLG